MRYRDLRVETRREAPSRAKSPGTALLVRAGYVTTEGEPTNLGRIVASRLEEAAAAAHDFWRSLALPVWRTAGGEILLESSGGDIEALACRTSGYAERRELAKARRPLPLPEQPLPIGKVSTPGCTTIDALSTFLGVGNHKTAKALMYVRGTDGRFVVAVIRGDMQLSERKLVGLVGDIRPASPEEIATSGAVIGYTSPIGLTGALVVVDDLVPNSPNLVAGANEAGFHLVNTNFGRDYEAEFVADLSLPAPGDSCPDCGSPLASISAILLANTMGYRFDQILRAVAEVHHDERGLRFPASAAPFDVYLLHIPSTRADSRASAERLYQVLESEGLRVLFDDRDERAGVKFNDADLIGCPVRITVSERHMKNGMIEWKRRDQEHLHVMRQEDAVKATISPSNLLP